MAPSKSEIELAMREENDAMLDVARLLKVQATTDKEIRAARLRLMNARSAKRELVNDLMIYEN